MQQKDMNEHIDKYLSRSSHVAQIILVAVAVFGYFYTVVPVYQKDLLSEQISQKELELTELKTKISDFPKILESLKVKAQEHELQVIQLKQEELVAKQSVAKILGEKSQLERSLSEVRIALNSAKSAANKMHNNIYIESFSGAVMFQYLKTSPSPYEILDKQEMVAIDSFLVSPYQAIITVINDGNPQTLASAKLVPKRIKDAMNQRIKKQLLKHKHSLSIPLVDINRLIEDYNEKMKASAVDPTPEDRFNEVQHQLRQEYVKKLNDAYMNEMNRSTEFMEQF